MMINCAITRHFGILAKKERKNFSGTHSNAHNHKVKGWIEKLIGSGPYNGQKNLHLSALKLKVQYSNCFIKVTLYALIDGRTKFKSAETVKLGWHAIKW